MPILSNPRHELFAQGLAKGLSGKAAYCEAGYRSSGNAAEVGAAKLVRNSKVAARVLELQARQARRLDVTVERITVQLLEDRALAYSQGQAAAAVAASMALAKLHGLVIDRAAITSYRKPLREASEVKQMTLMEWQERFAPKRLEGPAPAQSRSIPAATPEEKDGNIADNIRRCLS